METGDADLLSPPREVKLMLVVPKYEELSDIGDRGIHVELTRTKAVKPQLQFWGGAAVTAECINSDNGCPRCTYVDLLRELLLLDRKGILRVSRGKYVNSEGNFASLSLDVDVRNKEKLVVELDYGVAVFHLREDFETQAQEGGTLAALAAAVYSSCHIVGCTQHQRQPPTLPLDSHETPPPLSIPSMVVSASEAQLSPTSTSSEISTNENLNLYDLFRSLKACFEEPPDMALNGDVSGLKLELFQHQRKGSGDSQRDDDSERELEQLLVGPDGPRKCYDFCGWMLCDEPGLGKTITVLALILRTKGETTKDFRARGRPSYSRNSTYHTRLSKRQKDQAVALVSSFASLIVVPSELLQHWANQINEHVERDVLRVFVDDTPATLPRRNKLATYDVVLTTMHRIQTEWKNRKSSLRGVHWLRLIVDEGHKLGTAGTSNFKSMARELYVERRWVVTGTPAPNTSQWMDLQYMHGLLAFLRNDPYTLAKAWLKGIACPFMDGERVAYMRLQQLLCRVMIRHTKEEVLTSVPPPTRHNVVVEPTLTEFNIYNLIAESVRANLAITDMDTETPGNQRDSTLKTLSCGFHVGVPKLDSIRDYFDKYSPRQMTECCKCKKKRRILIILPCGCLCCRCCIEDWKLYRNHSRCNICDKVYDEDYRRFLQPTMTGEVTTHSRDETIQKLIDLGVSNSGIERVRSYLDTRLPREFSACHKCSRRVHVLIVHPCGDLCCADCMKSRYGLNGPSCCLCGKTYDPDDIVRLQPDISYKAEEEDAPRTKRKRTPISPSESRHDFWKVDSGKIFYMISRLRELSGQNAKTIVFLQYAKSMLRVRIALSQHGIATAKFIPKVALEEKLEDLKRFRSGPDVNVLLLSNTGAYGLDLTNVTHMFLLEEIWDKSLEQQVISRAYRMGASHSVTVEKLWMKGGVESQMTIMIDHEEVRPYIDDTDEPPTREEVIEASSTDNESFPKMKVEFLLRNMRLLHEVPEDNKLQFTVFTEGADKEKNVVRRGAVTIAGSGGGAPSITLIQEADTTAEQ